MGVGSGGQRRAVPPASRIFKHGTDKVEGGLMVHFFGLVFSVAFPSPWNYVCRCPCPTSPMAIVYLLSLLLPCKRLRKHIVVCIYYLILNRSDCTATAGRSY